MIDMMRENFNHFDGGKSDAARMRGMSGEVARDSISFGWDGLKLTMNKGGEIRETTVAQNQKDIIQGKDTKHEDPERAARDLLAQLWDAGAQKDTTK